MSSEAHATARYDQVPQTLVWKDLGAIADV